jgi:DNA-binding beta-propeller fold protein YncE
MFRTIACFGLTVLLALFGCDDKNVNTEPADPGPEGRLYVLNQNDATLYVYDTQTMLRIDSIDTRVSLPHYIDFSPDGQYFYITTLEPTGHIAKFSADSNTFIDSVSVPPAVVPSAIAITTNGQFGYVCNFTLSSDFSRIHKYDLNSLQLVDSVQGGARSHDLKITSDGSVVIACNQWSDNLTLIYPDGDTIFPVSIDPDSMDVKERHKYGPIGAVIDHKDSLAFIACLDAHQVRVLDIAARAIVDSIDIPVDMTTGSFAIGPTLLAISPNDDVVFVTTQGGNSIVVFRYSTKEILADIPLSTPSPFGITISNDGSRVYAACTNRPNENGMVYVIDGNSYAKIDSVKVGRWSFGLTWRR